MEGTFAHDGDMFKLTADNYSYWKPMMEDHLYCKDLNKAYLVRRLVKLEYSDDQNMIEHLNTFK
ncbi:hypothetical protein CR513_17248, partial [Mucuna pruriens]